MGGLDSVRGKDETFVLRCLEKVTICHFSSSTNVADLVMGLVPE